MLSFGMEATYAASVWATIALVVFIGLVMVMGAHKAVGAAIDKRIAQVENDLAEAARLREEAAAMLAEYERRRVEAEAEAEGIVRAAQEEAVRLTAEAATALEQLIARRTRTVEDKIAQAEAQAVAEVRARSADLAIEAARIVLTRELAAKGDALVDKAIADVGSKLN